MLSGDHLKASSDALLPLVGVGLLYQNGYLQQKLDPDGWQQETHSGQRFLFAAHHAGGPCRGR